MRGCSTIRRLAGFTLVELLVVIAIIGMLAVLLLPAVNAAREASRRTTCLNHQRQIGIAVQNFESARLHFPPGQYRWVAGEDRWSWCTLIMPFMEANSIYARIDFYQPITSEWNKGTPNNPGPTSQVVETFLCPSAGSFHETRDEGMLNELTDGDESGLASLDYVALSGPFHDSLDPFGQRYGYNRGVFVVLKSNDERENTNSWLRPHPLVNQKQITDGLSKTLMLTECTGRGWATGMKAALHDGRNVGSLGKDTLKDFSSNSVSITAGINAPPAIAWRNEEPFSDHPGGVNGLMADGSARFFVESTARPVLRALASRDGNEPPQRDDTY